MVNAGGLVAVAIVGLGLRAALGGTAVAGAVQPPEMPVPLEGLTTGSYLLFRNTTPGPDYGRAGLVAAIDPSGPRAITGLSCDRVDFEGGVGLCLNRPTTGLLVSTTAVIFDAHFRSLHEVELTGLPSRARVSPNGQWGAVTTFVVGDSYASAGVYSTRTDVIDMRTGKVLFDLEQLAVSRNGQGFSAADFNFWGVTFSADEQHFYATLGTGGDTYLIAGDLLTRKADVIATNVECPSLSPNGKQIAFKRRLPGLPIRWRLSVLDLATMKVHALAETRSIDDQAEWLNDDTVLYGVYNGTPSNTGTWSVPADGSGSPKLLNTGTFSEVVTDR